MVFVTFPFAEHSRPSKVVSAYLCLYLAATSLAHAQSAPNVPAQSATADSDKRGGADGPEQRSLSPPQTRSGSISHISRPPYALNQSGYKQELDSTNDPKQKLDVLSRRWNDVALAVFFCDVVTGPASFHRSTRYWQSNWLETGTWTIDMEGDLVGAQGPQGSSSIRIKGNCRSDVAFTGLIHVYGDLASKLQASGQSEVVIAGDVSPSGVIETDGIARVFVGGNVKGEIRNKGSAMIWIHGDLDADISAGFPTINIHIMGDCRGDLRPVDKPALAYLDVRGSMSSERIRKNADRGWTEFHASIGISDVLPGLYPRDNVHNAYWIVHSTNRE